MTPYERTCIAMINTPNKPLPSRNPETSGEVQTGERKKVLVYYIVFFGSLLMLCIPLIYTALIGFLLSMATVAAMYSTRSNADEDGYVYTHMTYLIHTFWYAGLFLFYSAIVGGLYFVIFVDYFSLYACFSTMADVAYSSLRYGSGETLIQTGMDCLNAFIIKNKLHLIISSFLALGPIVLYLVFRYVKGWRNAAKHLPIRK